MKLSYFLVLAACLGFAAAGPVSAQSDEAAVATATDVLDAMDAGEFEAVTRQFNAQMAAALGVDQLQAVQGQIEATGPVLSRGEPRVTRQDGHRSVLVRIQRQHAALDASVAIDGDGKVAGLHFLPASGGPQ